MDYRQQLLGGMIPQFHGEMMPHMLAPQLQHQMGHYHHQQPLTPNVETQGFHHGGSSGNINHRLEQLERKIERIEREQSRMNRRLSRLESHFGHTSRQPYSTQEYY